MASFIVRTGKMQGQRLNLGSGSYVLGRDTKCQICVPSSKVSRLHCEFEIGTTHVTVRDVGSRNGTVVNGELIDGRIPLEVGDVVDVGPMQLELVTKAPPKRLGSVAPHVAADESQVADSIVDWLKDEDKEFISQTVKLPVLEKQDTALRKFNDVAEEGKDIIRRFLESQETGLDPDAEADTEAAE